MRHLLTASAVALAVLTTAVAESRADQPLVFRDVNVVPMDEERVIEGRTVVIEHGRIVRIAAADEVEIPPDAEVIDAADKFLMPGLAEMHAHVPGAGDDEQYQEDVLFLYLSQGITLARGMLGEPLHLRMRDELARGERLGPRLVTTGPSFSGGSVDSPDHARRMVREQVEAGYDRLKIHPGLTREQFDAMAETADAAGIRFVGHVPEEVGLLRAFEAGYETIDHLDAYMPLLVDPEETEGVPRAFFGFRLAPYVEPEKIHAVAERTRQAGVWNVPTEMLMHSVLTVDIEDIRERRPEFVYMPPDVVDGWIAFVERFRAGDLYDRQAAEAFVQVRLDLTAALHEAGAGLLLGSDAPQFLNVPGFSTHREMQVMVDAGLSPYEVLRTGTVNVAEYLGQEGIFGRVAEGMQADLVLVEANPLEDIAHAQQIAGVVRHGRWLSAREIQARLQEIETRHAPP